MDKPPMPAVRLDQPPRESPPGTTAPDLPPQPRQWFGFLGGPTVWAVAFFVSYALVPSICARGGLWILQVIPVVAALLIVGAGLLSWRNWTTLAERGEDAGREVDRARFMALAGMILSVGFGLLMVAQLIPTFLIHPCR